MASMSMRTPRVKAMDTKNPRNTKRKEFYWITREMAPSKKTLDSYEYAWQRAQRLK